MTEQHHELMTVLQYRFNDLALLQQALTHRSHKDANNERLEFLGDAILGMVMAAELFNRYPDAREGELSRMRSLLVSGEALAELATELLLDQYLWLGDGEEKSGGRQRPSILSDAVEAVIAAIFLDSDVATAKRCVLAWYQVRLNNLSLDALIKDPKSQLQEWLQARQLPLPCYDVVVTGQAHAQTFEVTCTVEGMDIVAKGTSTSRRKAEQLAAMKFLEKLGGQ